MINRRERIKILLILSIRGAFLWKSASAQKWQGLERRCDILGTSPATTYRVCGASVSSHSGEKPQLPNVHFAG